MGFIEFKSTENVSFRQIFFIAEVTIAEVIVSTNTTRILTSYLQAICDFVSTKIKNY